LLPATTIRGCGNRREPESESQQVLAECRAERDEALAQQAATSEILRVINSSPGDLDRVFTTILDKALDLCEAAFGFVTIYDGERFERGVQRGVIAPTPSLCLCLLWVKSRHRGTSSQCPLYPRKRTFCAAVEAMLFDYLVSGRE